MKPIAIAPPAPRAPAAPPAPQAREASAGGRFAALLAAEPSGLQPNRPTARPASGEAAGRASLVGDTLQRLVHADAQIDQVMRAAAAGKSFTAAELLALQAQVFRYSQTVEIVSRTTDRLVGALKQTLGTQV